MITTEHILIAVSAVVAVLLQVLVAPHIAIGYAHPDFVAVLCAVVALVQPGVFRHALPFVLGLVYDLLSGGPVGAMAFTLTAASAFSGWVFRRSSNDTLFMGLVAVAAGLLFVEVVYGMFLLMFGYAANLLEAFAFRMLPCFIYDLAFGLVLYPVAVRFLSGRAPVRSEITQLH